VIVITVVFEFNVEEIKEKLDFFSFLDGEHCFAYEVVYVRIRPSGAEIKTDSISSQKRVRKKHVAIDNYLNI